MKPAPVTRPSLLLSMRDVANHRAWADFVDIYTPLIFGHCTRRGLQEADAADVTQEVMRSVARAIQKLEYSRSRGTFRGWLLTVTRSKLNNFFSSRARQPQGAGDTILDFLATQPGHEPEDDWETEYRKRLFQVAAERIKTAERIKSEFQANTRSAFWRTAVEDQPVGAVAAKLGLSVGAVYIARSRVLARLRLEIEMISEESDLLSASP
jgi:RNA polymerase sigma factor (sigma-70 family)